MLKIIKVQLKGTKEAWLEELPGVFWAYYTTARTFTGETSFKLNFGTKAVIPVEVSLSSLRRETFNEKTNEESRCLDLDYLDEVKEEAL